MSNGCETYRRRSIRGISTLILNTSRRTRRGNGERAGVVTVRGCAGVAASSWRASAWRVWAGAETAGREVDKIPEALIVRV